MGHIEHVPLEKQCNMTEGPFEGMTELTLSHLALLAQTGLFLISTHVSQRGLATARNTQLAKMMASTIRLNQGFSTN